MGNCFLQEPRLIKQLRNTFLFLHFNPYFCRMKLSHLAETLVGSEIVKMGNEINDRIRQGERIFNFTVGDFDPTIFPIPQQLEDAIIDAYKHHYTNYPPADGILELRTAVSEFYKDWLGLDYATNEILITSGGAQILLALH